MRALPIFKEDYCRNSISGLYLFNGVDSFCDLHNHNLYNSSKMSWDGWYYFYCDEDDNVYLNKYQLEML